MIPIFQQLNSDCYDRNRKVLAKITIILVGIYAGKWGKLDRGVFNSNNYKLLKEVCICYPSMNFQAL